MTTSPEKLLSLARESGGAVHDMGRGLYAVTFGEVSLPEFVRRTRQDEREKVRELLTEAVDFWQTYSSMSEQYQDDMAAERNAMLEKMEDAIRSISTTESKGERDDGE
jgi:hypothetical protein